MHAGQLRPSAARNDARPSSTRFAGTETAPDVPPDGFAWVSAGQLTSLCRHSHYLNVQARSLLACLRASALETNTHSA
nr:NDP-hexose 2,3-dehydratase family protein [Streptomyces sp. NBC_00830]